MKPEVYRKTLHQIPELGYEEIATQAFIKEHLQKLSGTLHEISPTGLLFYFDAGKEKTLAFRSDMDALPIAEKTGLPFASKNLGKMHACGHDGHMGMLLSFADYCEAYRKELPCNVVLIFQPAEETGSGAEVILKSGLLEKYQVAAIFGFHVWPQLPAGHIFSKPAGLLAQCSEIDVTFKGKATHIANANRGIDAVKMAAHFLTDLDTLEEKSFAEFPHLLKFGEISGGHIRNIIADEVVARGSLRSFDKTHHTFMKRKIRTLAAAYEAKTGGKVEISYTEGYPVVYNNPQLFEKVQGVLPELEVLENPFLQGEDFGQYTETYPCVFFLLGLGDVPPLHNEAFDFSMDLLENGVKTYKSLLQLAKIF